MKDFLKDSSKFVIAATPVIADTYMATATVVAAKEEERKEEPSEELNNGVNFV